MSQSESSKSGRELLTKKGIFEGYTRGISALANRLCRQPFPGNYDLDLF